MEQDLPSSQGADSSSNACPPLINELLQKSPEDVAEWVVGQVKAISVADVHVKESPIFLVFAGIGNISEEQKQALIANTVQGFASLPDAKKAEAFRLIMPALGDAQAPFIENGTGQLSDSEHISPLTDNLKRLKDEASVNMSEAELATINELVQKESNRIGLSEVFSVVSELNEYERKQFAEALLSARLIPGEKRGLVEGVFGPGGVADTIAEGILFLSRLRLLSMSLVFFIIAEVLAIACFRTCSSLIAWLIADAMLMVAMLVVACVLERLVRPVYQAACADPCSALFRWQAAVQEGCDLDAQVRAALPDISNNIRICIFLECFLVLSLIVGTGLGIALMVFVAISCGLVAGLVCVSLVVLKLCFISLLMPFAIKTLRKFREITHVMKATPPRVSYNTFSSV